VTVFGVGRLILTNVEFCCKGVDAGRLNYRGKALTISTFKAKTVVEVEFFVLLNKTYRLVTLDNSSSSLGHIYKLV
jgi:hypothetical protein